MNWKVQQRRLNQNQSLKRVHTCLGAIHTSTVNIVVTHFGLVVLCGDTDPGRHWFRPVALGRQKITQTNVDLSAVTFCINHPKAIIVVNVQTTILYNKFEIIL